MLRQSGDGRDLTSSGTDAGRAVIAMPAALALAGSSLAIPGDARMRACPGARWHGDQPAWGSSSKSVVTGRRKPGRSALAVELVAAAEDADPGRHS